MGSFNRKSEFQIVENMDKPVTPGEKFNVTNDPLLSLLREFWRNNYVNVILTVEADSLPTAEKKLLDDCGLVGCHSSRSNDLSVHARIDSSRYVRLLRNQTMTTMDIRQSLRLKFGKKAEGVTTESRERSAESLFHALESIALPVEGSDLGSTEDIFVPTASCIQDTKKRQLVMRSCLPRPRCWACHLHHKRAMKPPAAVRQFFKTVLQQA